LNIEADRDLAGCGPLALAGSIQGKGLRRPMLKRAAGEPDIVARRVRTLLTAVALSAALGCGSAGCNIDNLLNQTASFGGDTAGGRSNFQYVVVNNTPFRALFTAGAYDDLDQKTQPTIQQAGNDPDGTTLEGNSSTPVLTAPCSRVFAIGTQQLLFFVEENLAEDAFNPDLLVPGVFFSSGELGTEEGGTATEGVAEPLEVRLGADFPCNGLLVIRLEFDDDGPNGFRIDFEVIPAEDDRNPPA
jgi:hypothetical protein